ncbi:hypothetical protein NC651_039131 [Populus alba x Populus x berolinensis]|nr:hypothetical protein NC651_039131 [Populus alba x Populus x berolinensis]
MLYSREVLNFLVRKDVRKILKRKDSDAGERGRALEELRSSLFSRFRSSESTKRHEQQLCGPVIALTFNFLVAIGIIFMNKWVLQGVGFHFPICLSFIHYALSWALMAIIKTFSVLPASPPSKSSRLSLFTLGFVMSFSTGLANVSLKYNSVGFYQMAKISVTPSIVLAEFIWFKKRVSFSKVVALTVVSIGVAVATVTDLQFSLFGACVALAWIIPSDSQQDSPRSTLQQQDNTGQTLGVKLTLSKNLPLLMWKTTPITLFFLASLIPFARPPQGGGDLEISGSPTEKAIMGWAIKLGMNFDAVRSESNIIHVFPFNSEKKKGGVALQLPDSQVHIHWKGAAEIVLASCTKYVDASGNTVPLDQDKVSFFKKAIEDMACSSLRCVSIAYRTYDMDKVPADEQQLTQWVIPQDDLILLAIIGIKDPCRPGVRDAVRLCQNAGVKVRMVTGDNPQTAKAIALECGILNSEEDAVEPNVIEGRVFREYEGLEREEIAEKISVMGRSSPNDKLLLVQALKRRGHVVAVTGDGTNDAPALHEADIGLSMGIQGTEVAKESSDIIILDDNFASVVKVVRWGRSVYANIQKFIQFQLTVNVAALIINVVSAMSSGEVPLNAVQLLWVNLIMDTLGALALATEPPTDHLMNRSPVGRREPLITNIMWRNLLIQAGYQVTVLLVLNFRGESLLGLEHETPQRATEVKNTLIFNAFVLCQIFNEFNARKPDEKNIFKGISKNHVFIAIIAITLVLQVIIVEFVGKFTSTVKLNWKQWLLSVIIGFISWPLAALAKLIPVPQTPLHKFFTNMCNRRPKSSKSSKSSLEVTNNSQH